MHLNTLESFLGGTLDETSFINESVPGKVSATNSKKIYKKLVEKGFICHYKVRSCYWKRPDVLEPLIREKVEPCIADDLISLLIAKHASITEMDLNPLVYSCEELWSLLAPVVEPAGALLDVSQVDAKLPDGSLKQSWNVLKEKFSDRFRDSATQLVLPPDDPLYQTLQEKDYEDLTTHLRSITLFRERALVKDDACEQMMQLELGKYDQCKIKNEEGNNEQSLRDFLINLFTYCHDDEENFCYEHMLPFDYRAAETKKLHVFLQEQEILKSDSLVSHGEDDLQSLVEEALDEEDCCKEQLEFIRKVVQRSYGEVCGFKNGSTMEIGFTDFYSLRDRPQDIPEALDFFTSWNLDGFSLD